MRCVDVNVLVYAHRRESPDHQRYRAWLEAARRADEPLGLSSVVLSGFVRVVTHPRVFKDPTPVDIAFAFADVLRSDGNVAELQPGPRHWELFRRLCDESDARGNHVPDAYLAALAIERDATWWSADRGLARYPGLRLHHPLDG